MKKRFLPDLTAVIRAASNEDPALIVYAINSQLEPVVDRALSSGAEVEREVLLWILMEITLNAVNARIGAGLVETTGYVREKLLEVFGVNILYPDSSADSKDSSVPEATVVAGRLGMDIPRFVKLSLSGKFSALGVITSPGWVTIDTEVSGSPSGFSILVRSEDPIVDEDHEAILWRYRDPVAARREILEKRKPWGDDEGIFRMPSFTGGGGVGLLACITHAGEAGMNLEYVPEEEGERLACFRVSYPVDPEG